MAELKKSLAKCVSRESRNCAGEPKVHHFFSVFAKKTAPLGGVQFPFLSLIPKIVLTRRRRSCLKGFQ
jgi:hypothetical protein